MATVSGAALPNSSFPIIGIGAGASARPPSIRDISGTVGASITSRDGNQNGAARSQTPISAVEAANGVRPGGANGALLDLATSLTAQEASGQEESVDGTGLTEAEQEQVAELRRADAEVRRHEAAHAAVGGAFASAPTFTFVRGPDGRQYAVAGEVSIDTSPVEGDPEATIRKLQVVRRAALAPADPSAQDRAVAAQADAAIRQAQAELQAQRAEELAGEDGAEEASGVTESGAGSEAGAEGASTPFDQALTPQDGRDLTATQGEAASRIIDIAV